MRTIQHALLVFGLFIQALLIIGGARRKNLRICVSFFLYLVVGFLSSLVVTFLSGNLHGGRLFYTVKEFILDAIKIALLVELNFRIFRYYPRVKRSNLLFFALGGIFLLFYIWLVPPEKLDWWGTATFDLLSKIMQTTCFIFFVLAGSILFYRLQIDSRHKFLLLGFLFSQFPLALGYAVVAAFGERARPFVNLLNPIFFVLALLIWSKVYFRRDQPINSIRPVAPGLDLSHDSGAPQ